MKKMLCMLTALICLTVFPTAMAEAPQLWLCSSALDTMTWVTGESFEEGYSETFMTADGMIVVEVLNLGGNEAGMVGEGSFLELLELRAEGDMREGQDVPCESLCGCPAQRVRYETGANEDASVVDATAIWEADATFLYIVQVDAEAWYGFRDGYDEGAAQEMIDGWIAGLEILGYEESEPDELEANGYGFFGDYVETEFFRVGIPDSWKDQFVYEIIPAEPFGYTINFSEKESGFVFSLEARWFDDETVQLESVWQGYLGRLSVDRLGYLDLLVTYAQPAPDASAVWQMMAETCREVADTLFLQEGVAREMGEYLEYQP